MPGQVHRRQVGTEAFVENAFEVGFDIFFVELRFGTVEEIGRRQLPWVADHDHLAATCDRADGIPDRNL
ncbi:MAG: hypothetical protein AW09_004385 [Candidatus Accumulibacter phosphatis]|uniref:Uncharacterized protein n=1 Tax=Candidatus Accumulibacter phosphatis TaxID=327160 RepID=A0A084Y718_9PROT|nr:MAG: hypothetical protein AW09_004385 [Candidatus Accumulibacter phosphatis]